MSLSDESRTRPLVAECFRGTFPLSKRNQRGLRQFTLIEPPRDSRALVSSLSELRK